MAGFFLTLSQIQMIVATVPITHFGTANNSLALLGLKLDWLPLPIQMQLDSLTDYAAMSLGGDSITELLRRAL